MPFSSVDYIPPVVRKLYQFDFTTVLDLGCGIGQWGYVIRFHHDLMHNRMKPEQWQKTILGVEVHDPYNNPVWGLYDRVEEAEIAAFINEGHRHDLIMMVEVLEHFDKATGIAVLKKIADRCQHFIFSFSNIDQGPWHGNNYEAHRSRWTREEIFSLFPQAEVLFETDINFLFYVKT